MPHRPVQAQLAQDQRIVQLGLHLVRGQQDAHRNRQVVRRPLLAQVRRRQVDGQPVRRVDVAAVAQRRPHPLAALAHGRVRQPHQRHPLEPTRNVDLYIHRLGI